ncbi:HAMP domain-containing protein [Actinoplanes sp. TBRC 11911]|uniref:sensor histidine kinase n=1 Tax=Actinoplanes sp. TBRC 11911 TaxID=2729386 RepID=UPI00145EA75E|nr:ATP-binding protein [Actinoplanes sp. TBRC 11911]NMO53819.1 HAMP domain-containing protein [Actinoplanes sp. TBRC 11911]
MLFGKFRILGKLALLVLVPLLGVVALSVPIVLDRISAAQDAQKEANEVAQAIRVSTALQALQTERILSVGFAMGLPLVSESDLTLQTAKAIDAVQRIDDGSQLSDAMRRALRGATKLDNTRQNVLNRAINPDEIVTEFTNAATPLITAVGLAASADLRTSVGRQLFALERALRTDDQISQAASYLTAAAVSKNQALIGLFSSTLIQIQNTTTDAQLYFTDAQYRLYLAAQDAFSSRVGADFLTQAAINPVAAVQQLNLKTLFPSLQSVLVLSGFVEKRVASDVNTLVTGNRDNAIRDAVLIGGGSILLLLLVVLLSLFMARAVARPLRRLTASADRVAREAEAELERVADDEEDSVRPIRLDPVDVAGQDEIGDLARAFDRVQTTAVRLVERQVLGRRNVAQMFAHVGRRTQNLVGRQLALIDNLERRETDSERLGELYRLDHMSSRLRRNASSLVVLSGGAGANEHMAPLPLSDVVRLALGEIEDYTRVDVDVPDDIMVVPSLPADLILLLAELMENATAYSPPHTRVSVTANELRGGVRLAIVDQGLGMPPERLVEENARLTRRERLDLAPSEVLGLFVVGRLARRHSIDVHLSETQGGGITAWVDLNPQHLVTRVESNTVAAVPPFPSVVPPTPVQGYHTSEFAQVIAGSAARSSVPGSQQPFDPVVLERATRTLENGHSWNAFAPVRASAPVIEAPVYDAEPVYSPGPAYQEPATYGQPTGFQKPYQEPYQQPYQEPYQAPYQEPYQEPRQPEPVYRNDTAQPAIDLGAPVAGRVPAALPELPAAGPGAWTAPPATPQATWTTPTTEPSPVAPAQPRIPRQRVDEDHRYATQPDRSLDQPSGANPLRRRVPGNQLPMEAGTKLPAAPPSQDDAVAARAAFEAFEAGVSRAQWDAVETDMSSPPAAGHAPLARRVPGATLPMDEPNSPPPPTMAPPLDPDAARALMEQFEYGVALALNETQPQPEGQPR